MLHIEQVVKRFGEVEAVNGISLTIPAGQMVGIIGRSGAGKSTLLTLLVQVENFVASEPRTIRGPGVQSTVTLRIAGLGQRFWQDWRQNALLYPCGLDVVCVAGNALLGLPRSVTETDRTTGCHASKPR